MMGRVSKELGHEYVDHWDEFPISDRWLWSSKDSIHQSTGHGLPVLLKGSHSKSEDLSYNDKQVKEHLHTTRDIFTENET